MENSGKEQLKIILQKLETNGKVVILMNKDNPDKVSALQRQISDYGESFVSDVFKGGNQFLAITIKSKHQTQCDEITKTAITKACALNSEIKVEPTQILDPNTECDFMEIKEEEDDYNSSTKEYISSTLFMDLDIKEESSTSDPNYQEFIGTFPIKTEYEIKEEPESDPENTNESNNFLYKGIKTYSKRNPVATQMTLIKEEAVSEDNEESLDIEVVIQSSNATKRRASEKIIGNILKLFLYNCNTNFEKYKHPS